MPFPYLLPILFTGAAPSDERITDSILASALQNSEDIKAYDILFRDRLNELDLSPLLIYMIDTVPAVALPHLAAQFDILGYKGWRFAKTEAQQRDLLKKAIELHRFKGTPWSIKEAIRRAGYADATIIEGGGQFLDGTWNLDGTYTLSGAGNWACFRVIFDLGNTKGISAEETQDITELVKEYKNARSKLLDISWVKNLEDTVTATDDVAITLQLVDAEDAFSGRFLDGTWNLNGSVRFDAYSDEVTINILG